MADTTIAVESAKYLPAQGYAAYVLRITSGSGRFTRHLAKRWSVLKQHHKALGSEIRFPADGSLSLLRRNDAGLLEARRSGLDKYFGALPPALVHKLAKALVSSEPGIDSVSALSPPRGLKLAPQVEGKVPPMLANQGKLPRLPLPSLDDTLARYLKAAKPLVSAAAFEATETNVRAALEAGSDVRALQAKLVEADEAQVDENYVAKVWESMYLEGRWGLALNSNPGIVSFGGAFGPNATTQVQRAARMVSATLAFAIQVESGTLKPDVFKKVPVDMVQYTRMFASTRIPAKGRDVLRKAASAKVAHIVVLRRDAFWSVPVIDSATGLPLSVRAIEGALQAVIDGTPDGNEMPSPPSLAVLTTTDRDVWAVTRKVLAEHSEVNAESLSEIDDALFHVVLDAPSAGGGLEGAVRASLHGEAAMAPRWNDKGVSIMVTADATPLCQFEHSWGDGIAIARWLGEMFGRIKAARYPEPAELEEGAPPHKLGWVLPPSVAKAVGAAAAAHAASCGALDVCATRFTEWGPAQIKEWGCSPDGTVQAAMQLAFYRVAGHTPSTYESCSTAHFKGGRTETIRSATTESADFVAAVVEGMDVAVQASRLRASAKRHAAVCREAAEGKGIDRHLFALKALAPAGTALFDDPSYATLSGNELSTTTLTLEPVQQSSFGPVHAEGYGVSYHMPPDELRFCTTAYAPRDAQKFGAELEKALRHIGTLLSTAPPPS